MKDTNELRRRVISVMPPLEPVQITDPLLQHLSDEVHSKDGWRSVFIQKGKIKWSWAPAFFAFWLLLYICISVPAYHQLPEPISIQDEASYPERFIAERAEMNMIKLTELGPRVVGSVANEVHAIQYFMEAVQKLRTEASPMYEILADVQMAAGNYCHGSVINAYQGIQNVVIKVGEKNSTSTSYLLVNSHYDSVPQGRGAGDDATMVAIMLETIRVIVTSSEPLKNPVIFLFNGAEENPMQGSHAFITQHKWAKYAKAVINLDSAGNGGRELVFQCTPDHPWLMKYYGSGVMHPMGSTIAEEFFQRKYVPSDTDFRIFRDFGELPGLDLAHQYNGYVYHTRHDIPDIIPRGTFQHTGDNVLGLVRELANAPELEDPSSSPGGHVIFFDLLGSKFIFYTEAEGNILNVLVSLAAITLCSYSLQQMANSTGTNFGSIVNRVIRLLAVQVLAIVAGVTLCFFIGILMDSLNRPLSWFTNSWLIIGLYFCPLYFALGIVPALYFYKQRKHRFPLGYRVQLLLHSHCLFLACLTLSGTFNGIRSVFMVMISLLFYSISLIINLASNLYHTPLLWLLPHIICSIPPFVYYGYQAHFSFSAFVPMTGRIGLNINPELIICGSSVAYSLLSGGFVIPILHMFRKSKTIICSLLVCTVFFMILAATPLGFPYRAETNVQRVLLLHARNVFHDTRNAVRRMETGYFLLPQDRRTTSLKNNDELIMLLAEDLRDECAEEIFCGLPLYNHRWLGERSSGVWIRGPDPIFDKLPELKLISKKQLTKSSKRYIFQLKGPDHMTLFINPLQNSSITAWSFDYTPLEEEWDVPYFIYFSYGKDSTPLKFSLVFENPSGNWNLPIVEIGMGGHWNHNESMHTEEFRNYMEGFPDYVDAIGWPVYYETRFF